jgi:hypothetical protein
MKHNASAVGIHLLKQTIKRKRRNQGRKPLTKRPKPVQFNRTTSCQKLLRQNGFKVFKGGRVNCYYGDGNKMSFDTVKSKPVFY